MGRGFQHGICFLLTAAAFASYLAAQQPAAKPVPLPPINPNQAHASLVLGGLDGPGTALAYSEATGILAAGCAQGTIHYWDKSVTLGIRAGGRTAEVLHAHQGPVTSLAWSKGGALASAGVDKRVLVWAMPEGKILLTLTAISAVRALAVNPDGTVLASAGDAGVIQLWDLRTGKPVNQFSGHADWVLSLAFSGDGKLLASGGYDRFVRLWEVGSGKKVLDLPVQPAPAPNTPPGPVNSVLALAFSPDNKQVAIGGTDAQIYLVNVADGKIGRTLSGHESSISCLAFHPNGSLLVSASKDRTLRLWNPTNGQPIKSLEGHTSWVEGVTFMVQGTRLASVGADQTVRLWDF
jgi:WD40 repeat protein